MKRRNFIKAGALFVPAYMAGLSGIIRAGSAPSLNVAGTARVGTVSRPAGGGAGPDTWYYGVGSDDYATSGNWSLTSWVAGDNISVTTGGSLTKISYKAGDTAGTNVEIGLYYDNAGTWTFVTDACGEFASPTAAQWNDLTLGTPYTVADGAAVAVFMRSNGTWGRRRRNTNGGLAANVGVPVCDTTTLTTQDESETAVRVYVD